MVKASQADDGQETVETILPAIGTNKTNGIEKICSRGESWAMFERMTQLTRTQIECNNKKIMTNYYKKSNQSLVPADAVIRTGRTFNK